MPALHLNSPENDVLLPLFSFLLRVFFRCFLSAAISPFFLASVRRGFPVRHVKLRSASSPLCSPRFAVLPSPPVVSVAGGPLILFRSLFSASRCPSAVVRHIGRDAPLRSALFAVRCRGFETSIFEVSTPLKTIPELLLAFGFSTVLAEFPDACDGCRARCVPRGRCLVSVG